MLYCNFCRKSQHEVKNLISGPSVYICDECVSLCNDIIRSEASTLSTSTVEGLLTPEEIVARLDEYVIGQRVPKEILAIAAYHHYKRMMQLGKVNDGVEMEKSNVLLIGPSGSGKTHLAETLAKILNVPFATGDATSLTEAGYVGKDVEGMLFSLLQSCDMDVAKAEFGIIFVDEVDKLGGKESLSTSRDVGGTGVQNALLKMIEGTIAEVPPEGGRRHPNQEVIKLNTKNILFILAGAFDGLEKIIEKRMGKTSGGIGFNAVNVGGANAVTSKMLIHDVIPDDLVKFGLDPQFIGRLPVRATLDELDEETLRTILTKPKNALIKQYGLNFALDGAELVCDDDAIIEIARKAIKEKTGARSLRTICEGIFRKAFLTLPTYQRTNEKIAKVHLRSEHVIKGLSPDLVPEVPRIALQK